MISGGGYLVTEPNNISCFLHTHVTLTLSLTLCGLTGQKTHQGGPGLGGSVHEEAHPCFPYFAQQTFKSIDAGGFHRPLVQLIPPINYSIRKEIFTTVPCAPKFN